MNRHVLELRYPQRDQNSRLLLSHGLSKQHRKLVVEAFLDRLGIPHLKDEVQEELPFTQAELPRGNHRRWLHLIAGVILGIGLAMAWMMRLNSLHTIAHPISSFTADYEWDGFRRVMPLLR